MDGQREGGKCREEETNKRINSEEKRGKQKG